MLLEPLRDDTEGRSPTTGTTHSSGGRTSDGVHISPPEGGWGWLIVLAIALTKVAVWGAVPLFSIIYKDVISSTPGAEGSSVTLIIGILFLVAEATGIFFPAIHRIFSLRVTSIMGGAILFLGTVSSIFTVTVTQLTICYGCIQGVGYGLILSSSMTAFNEHFQRRRTTALATAQFSNSVVAMCLPYAVQAAMDIGGARGGRLVFVGCSFMAAVSQVAVRSAHHASTAYSGIPAENDKRLTTQVIEHQDEESSEIIIDQLKDIESEPPFITDKRSEATKSRRASRLHRCSRWLLHHLGFDQPELRTAAVWGPAVGLAMAHVGDSNFFALLPLHLYKVGLTKEQVTKAIAAANAGDAAGRLALIVAGFWLGRRNRHVFAVGSVSTAVCVLGISWLTSMNEILAFSAVLGVCRGMLYITYFLCVAEVVAPALFPAALALSFFFIVVTSVILAPLIGVVRDVSSSYPASFCFVAVLMALYPVAWGSHSLMNWYIQRRRRHHPSFVHNTIYANTRDF